MRIDQIASSRYNGFSQENVEGRLSAQAYRSGAQWQVELYSYDADGYLVAKRVMTQDMQSRDAPHTYNRNGDRQGRIHHRRTSLVSGSAFGLWYDYDTHGRPWKVFASTSTTKPGTPEATYTYFASGQKKSEQYRGNLALPYSYTIRGWLETIGAPRDSAYPYPFSAHYVYTNGGNVRFADSFHRKAVPGGTVPQGYRYAYSYDGMDGLTSANYAAWTGGTSFAAASLRFSTRNISYDRSGNILRLYRYNENGTMADNLTYTYSGGTSRLAGVSDAAGAAQTWDSGTLTGFYHDSNGNLTYYYDASRGHHYDMWYDEENRVSMYAEEHVTTGLYKETRYRYNAAGQRYWKKTDNANPEYYVMDGALTLGVIAPSGAVEWNIATASGEIVGRRTSGGQFRYYIKDHPVRLHRDLRSWQRSRGGELKRQRARDTGLLPLYSASLRQSAFGLVWPRNARPQLSFRHESEGELHRPRA